MQKTISDWLDDDGLSIQEQEFFLDAANFANLYASAKKRGQEPIEQLSPKGLSLLSYIYSQKDNDDKQPMIASSTVDFKHLVDLIAKADVGTKVTVILQPTDISGQWGPLYSQIGNTHKTVCQLERVERGVNVINMDSTNNDMYSGLCEKLSWSVLRKQPLEFNFYSQKDIPRSEVKEDSSNLFSRQNDEYQCGTFAFKDARNLIRDVNFLKNTFIENRPGYEEGDNMYIYKLPPLYMKSMQSKTFSTHVVNAHGEEIVNRKGDTLKTHHEKHHVSGYIDHFSQKYHDAVALFIETNKMRPEYIRACTEIYNAKNMTLEKLHHTFGPQAVDSQKKFDMTKYKENYTEHAKQHQGENNGAIEQPGSLLPSNKR